jgi:hypothetical protein
MAGAEVPPLVANEPASLFPWESSGTGGGASNALGPVVGERGLGVDAREDHGGGEGEGC